MNLKNTLLKTAVLSSAFLLLNTHEGKAQQYQTLHHFKGSDGRLPYGSLISNGSYLYGMTTAGGGANGGNDGVLFRVKPDGTVFDTLLNFTGTNGDTPRGSLISDGTYLYGTTYSGGTHGKGLLFKISPGGTAFDTVVNFTSNPNGDLFSDGTYLYGTASGGANGQGLIFRIMPNGTGYQDVYDFNYADGGGPYGGLISDGTYLYGMTDAAGAYNGGTIFKIQSNGTNFTKLLDFNDTNGRIPKSPLYYDGNFLYGMTTQGGTNDLGVVFKIKPDGTAYQKLLEFNGTNGSAPYGSFISDGTYLYGTTNEGGTNGYGLVFKIKPDGTGYQKMFEFSTANSGNPYGSLFSNGNYLYGTVSGINTDFDGGVFKLNKLCHDTTVNHSISACGSYTIGAHTYTISGTYTDTLQTTWGCDSIVRTNLTVNSLPSASYILTADAVPHVWDATPNISGGKQPYTYVWSWGDGTSDNTLYTSHTYSAAANYSVCLTVADNNSCSYTYCQKDSLYRTTSANAIIQLNVINNTTGLSPIEIQNVQVRIYPNPTSTILHVQCSMPNENEAVCIVCDVLGNVIQQAAIKNQQAVLDVNKLESGVYFIKVGNSIQKFIKQ